MQNDMKATRPSEVAQMAADLAQKQIGTPTTEDYTDANSVRYLQSVAATPGTPYMVGLVRYCYELAYRRLADMGRIRSAECPLPQTSAPIDFYLRCASVAQHISRVGQTTQKPMQVIDGKEVDIAQQLLKPGDIAIRQRRHGWGCGIILRQNRHSAELLEGDTCRNGKRGVWARRRPKSDFNYIIRPQ